MKSVTYFVRKTRLRSDNTTPIYIKYNYDRNNRPIFNTGKFVNVKYWDYTNSRLKRSDPKYAETYAVIAAVKERVEKLVDQAIINGIDPTAEYVKLNFDAKVLNVSEDRPKGFFEMLDEFIESSEGRVIPHVIKDYESLRRHLKDFQKKKRVQLTFDTIDYNNYLKLNKYLKYDHVKPDKTKGLAINTVGKHFKNLKAFIRYCQKRKVIEPMDLSFLKVEKEDVDSIYLNENEIQKIEDLDLSDKPEWKEYRDLFIIGCETGLRFSDYSDLRKEHFDGKFIRKRIQKTHKSVVIPISERLRRILEQYDYNPPSGISLTRFNKIIKKIGERAEINDSVVLVKKHGTEKKETIVEKYELISSHTCRRSFCTNQFYKGTSTLLIRKISGHKTETSFLKYIKVDEEDAAQKMLEGWGL